MDRLELLRVDPVEPLLPGPPLAYQADLLEQS
jgi:hypothetical protein